MVSIEVTFAWIRVRGVRVQRRLVEWAGCVHCWAKLCIEVLCILMICKTLCKFEFASKVPKGGVLVGVMREISHVAQLGRVQVFKSNWPLSECMIRNPSLSIKDKWKYDPV